MDHFTAIFWVVVSIATLTGIVVMCCVKRRHRRLATPNCDAHNCPKRKHTGKFTYMGRRYCKGCYDRAFLSSRRVQDGVLDCPSCGHVMRHVEIMRLHVKGRPFKIYSCGNCTFRGYDEHEVEALLEHSHGAGYLDGRTIGAKQGMAAGMVFGATMGHN